MQYQFILEEKDAQPTISIRTRTAVENLPQVLGKGYQAILKYLFEIGVQPSGAPLTVVQEHRLRHAKPKLPVVWLETNDSGDNNISLMNSTFPYLGRVFTEMIDLLYSNTLMAAQGREALEILEEVPVERL